MPVALELERAFQQAHSIRDELTKRMEIAKSFAGRIADVEERMKEAEGLAVQCLSQGINTQKEAESLATVDVNALRKSLEKGEKFDAIQRKTNEALDRLTMTIAALKQKLAAASQWPQWASFVSSVLERKEKVVEDDLRVIPQEWRRWALEKYMLDHPGEALVYEEGVLSKLKLPPVTKFQFDIILQKLLVTGKFEGAAVVRRDGLVVASALPPEINADAVAASSIKALAQAERASGELGKGRVNSITLNTGKGRMIVKRAGRFSILIALVSPQEDVGFILLTLERAIESIKHLLGE